jgi:myosin-1
LEEIQLKKTEYAFGRSKVFIRNPKSLLDLEEKRRARNIQLLIKIQSTFRAWRQRTKYQKMKKSATTIKARYKGYKARSAYVKQRNAAILIQSIVRMWKHRKVCRALCIYCLFIP